MCPNDATPDSTTCSLTCADAVHFKQYSLDRHRKRSKVAGVYKVTVADWMKILKDFDYRCAYCGISGDMTVDHVLPLSRGGRHCVANLVPACLRCNTSKGNLTIVEWRTGSVRKKKPKVKKDGSEALPWTVNPTMGVRPVHKRYQPKETPIFGQVMQDHYNRNIINGIPLTVDHFGILM